MKNLKFSKNLTNFNKIKNKLNTLLFKILIKNKDINFQALMMINFAHKMVL